MNGKPFSNTEGHPYNAVVGVQVPRLVISDAHKSRPVLPPRVEIDAISKQIQYANRGSRHKICRPVLPPRGGDDAISEQIDVQYAS